MVVRFVWLLASALAICAQTPEQRAIDYLTVEVPRWSRENGCFSCHNNGDAARALFAARDRGMKVPREALADTLGWLSRPAAWQENKGNPAFSDKKPVLAQKTRRPGVRKPQLVKVVSASMD